MLSAIVVFSLLFTNPMLVNAKESQCKYAKTIVNIRAKPKLKSKIVGKLYWNDGIKIIKSVNKKWYQVKYKGKVRYISKQYLKKRKSKYREYNSPSSNSFKSCEPASCITTSMSLPQGRLHKKYRLDYSTGVYMVGNRYCVALGSYYTTKIGTKIDLVLSHNGRKHVLKCILADQKANKDTVNNHRVHKDGSVAEFVINSSVMSHYARYTRGDVSYAGKQFRGKIVKIRVYK